MNAARQCVSVSAPLSDEELRDVVRNRGEPSLRQGALGLLWERIVESADRKQDTISEQLVELFGDLLDDTDPVIVRRAIRQCPLTEKRHIEKVRRVVDAPDEQIRVEAVNQVC